FRRGCGGAVVRRRRRRRVSRFPRVLVAIRGALAGAVTAAAPGAPANPRRGPGRSPRRWEGSRSPPAPGDIEWGSGVYSWASRDTGPGGRAREEAPMGQYYHPDHLAKFGEIGQGNKDLADKFFGWYTAVFQDGALSEREKSLIALAVAHAVQCPYCID